MLDEQGPLAAALRVALPSEADEVRVDLAVSAFGVADDQATAALSAVVVLLAAGPLEGAATRMGAWLTSGTADGGVAFASRWTSAGLSPTSSSSTRRSGGRSRARRSPRRANPAEGVLEGLQAFVPERRRIEASDLPQVLRLAHRPTLDGYLCAGRGRAGVHVRAALPVRTTGTRERRRRGRGRSTWTAVLGHGLHGHARQDRNRLSRPFRAPSPARPGSAGRLTRDCLQNEPDLHANRRADGNR